jgi:hypothetical protein
MGESELGAHEPNRHWGKFNPNFSWIIQSRTSHWYPLVMSEFAMKKKMNMAHL